MNGDDLDRIFSSGSDIVPSSGFAGSVMDAVRTEISAPPPIPFPWKRAVPGLVAGLALLAVLIMTGRRAVGPSGPGLVTRLSSVVEAARQIQLTDGTVWVVVALLLTLASMWLSRRLVRGRP